jgi:putative endonuclease
MSFTDKQKIGNLGEEIGCRFLMKHGFSIKDRNYRKKWGEIDIIAEKDSLLHFIEVKSVSRVTNYNPEENVHPWKQKRLARAVQTYLLEKKIPEETEWQIDIMAIFLDFKIGKAKIRMTENVILG